MKNMKTTTFIFTILLTLTAFASDGIRYYGDAIDNLKSDWSDEQQGMCHDESFIYLTRKGDIWRIPRHRKIEDSRHLNFTEGVIKASIPQHLRPKGSHHMGDCDVHDGVIYIPLEGTVPQKLLLFQAGTLKYISAPDLSKRQRMAPWVTVDPVDGSIYSGHFDLTKKDGFLKYRLSKDMQSLELIATRYLKDRNGAPMELKGIQGGDIVRSRNIFWFVSHTQKGGGLFGYDLKTGRLIKKKIISYGPGFPKYEELEGLDTLEDYEQRFFNYPGNLFVCMLDNNYFHDSFFLKNYEY